MPPELVEHEAYIIDTWARYGARGVRPEKLGQYTAWLNTFALESPPAVPFNPPASYPDGSDASDPPASKRRDPWVVLWLIAAVLSTPTEFLVPISMACVAGIAALRRRGPAGRAGRAIGYRRAGSGGGGLMVPHGAGAEMGHVSVLALGILRRCCAHADHYQSGFGSAPGARDRPAGGADVAHPDCLPHGSGAWHSSGSHLSVFFRSIIRVPIMDFTPYQRHTSANTAVDGGTTFYFPQGNPYMWDGPLPSSPQLSRFLRLRREGDSGSGFRIDVPPGHRARVR